MNKLIFFALIIECLAIEFSLNDVLKNSISLIPDSPSIVNVKFYLYNKNTSQEPISPNNISLNYNPTLKTKLIIHGFLHTSKKKWISRMKDALLKVENQNVVIVDW